MSNGSCLNDALSALLGYDVGLPDWVPGEENAAIAEQLGLRYIGRTHGDGDTFSVDLYEEDTVFVVPTTENKAHAIYMPAGRIGIFLERNTRPILCLFLR